MCNLKSMIKPMSKQRFGRLLRRAWLQLWICRSDRNANRAYRTLYRSLGCNEFGHRLKPNPEVRDAAPTQPQTPSTHE
jgi:hypothetical protein